MRFQIQTGYVYKFEFKTILNNLNGIYKIISFLTVEEMRNIKIDLYKDTFEPLGITEAEYETEFHEFYEVSNSDVLKLQNVDNVAKTIYIPEYYILLMPSINIKPYQKLGLSINLGVFEDSEELELIKNEISDIVATKVGIPNNTIVFSYEEKWLTDEEFNIVRQAREDAITNLSTIYSNNIELSEQISNLQGIINAYEEILLTLT